MYINQAEALLRALDIREVIGVMKIFALILALSLACAPAPAESGTFDLGIALMRDMEANDNLVISPLSLYIVMAMAGEGAQGETRAQLMRALGLDLNDSAAEAVNEMLALTDAHGSTTLNILCSVWLDERFTLSDEYARALASEYGAEAYTLDLSSAQAPEKINAWAEERTRGLIKRVLDAPYADDAAMALMNAVYINAVWRVKFSEDNTYDEAFTLADGARVYAPFMHSTAYYSYTEADDGARAVILDYDDGATAFMAVLPPEGATINEYMKTLDAGALGALIDGAECARVRLSLPKIETERALDLSDALKSMGVTRAFDAREADFGLIGADGARIHISGISQNVVMRVSEDGTEAAAVTRADMVMAAPITQEPIQLAFNRPYMYALYDGKTRACLFMGVVTDPSEFEFAPPRRANWSVNRGAPGAYTTTPDALELEKGTYSLYDGMLGVEADSAHPLDMKNLPRVKLTQTGAAGIAFEVEPGSVSVRYWPASRAGSAEHYEYGYEIAEFENGEALLPARGEYIVEITAEWNYTDLSGASTYAFVAVGE